MAALSDRTEAYNEVYGHLGEVSRRGLADHGLMAKLTVLPMAGRSGLPDA